MRESRQVGKCREPLELTPEAQRAFGDRQTKLINNPKWPLTAWYNDEDFCRAYNTAVGLQAEVKRLQAKLATVFPTMEAYAADCERRGDRRPPGYRVFRFSPGIYRARGIRCAAKFIELAMQDAAEATEAKEPEDGS